MTLIDLAPPGASPADASESSGSHEESDVSGALELTARRPRRWMWRSVLPGVFLTGLGFACGRDLAKLIDADLLIPLLVCAACGSFSVLVLPPNRWRASLVLLMGTVAVVLLGARGSFPALARGLLSGWRELLSTSVLAPNIASTRVVPLAFAFVIAWSSAWLHLRLRNGIAVLVPVCVGVIVSTLFGGSLGRLSPVAILLVVVPACGLLMVRGTSAVAITALRSRPSAAIATVLVAGLVATGAATLINSREPIRQHHTNDVEDEAIRFLNPMQIVADQRRNRPNETILRTNLPPGTNWRLITMDKYNPSGWTASTELQASGSVLTSPVSADPSVRTVPALLEVVDKSLPLLPLPDRTIRVGIDRVMQDPVSGAVRVDPVEYQRVIAVDVQPIPTQRRRRAITELTDTERERYRSLPSGDAAADKLIPALFAKSTEIVAPQAGQAVSGEQQADALAKYLRGPLFSVDETGGSGALALVPLAELVLRPGEQTARPEQFVTVFALMARLQGLPVRIVAGYRGGTATASNTVITGRDATLWPEVFLSDFGWTSFDPVPKRRGAAPDEQLTASPESDNTANSSGVGVGPGITPATLPLPERPGANEGSNTSTFPLWWLPLALIILGLLAAVGRLRYVHYKRNQARRGGNHEQRVMAAWRAAVRLLRGVGVSATPAMTADEVVKVATPTLRSPESLRELATLANSVRYAPTRTAEQSAEQAWRIVDSLGAELAAKVGVRYRILRAFDLNGNRTKKPVGRPNTA